MATTPHERLKAIRAMSDEELRREASAANHWLGKHARDSATIEHLDKAIDALAEILRDEIAGFEERLAALENKPASLDYKGVYRAGTQYKRGEAITHGGSLWIALQDTSATPGQPTEASRTWRLAVKRGDRGKDAT